jgi:hypothetical protein
MNDDADVRYHFGTVCGDAILALFEAIAAADGTTLQETIDDWVSGYVAERIVNGD